MQNVIKNYFKGYSKRGISKALPKFLRNNPEVELYLNNLLAENPNWENIRNIVYGICFDEHLTHCEFCDKEMNYYQSIRYNHRFCSKRCKQLAEGYNKENKYVKLLTPKSEYNGVSSGKIYKFKCLHCGHEFETKGHYFNYFPKNYFIPPCPRCYPNSFIQTKVFNSLVAHNFASNYKFIQNDRNLLSNHIYKNKHVPEIDIVVYKGNTPILGIEVNSSWTHSKQCYNAKHCKFNINMHLNKVKWSNEINLRLINIWDWELDEGISKTIKILEGRENLTFTEDIIKLDRGWFNNIEIPGYKLVEELPPEMINRNGFDVADCGKLVYNKKLGV